MTNLKTIPLGAVLFVLAACSGDDVANLKTLDLGGGGYDTALAREYKDFALYEAHEMDDLRVADRFALKSRAAARGERPEPEKLHHWNLPGEHTQELAVARNRLLGAVNDSTREHWPDFAAKAMARFDCWVEQQEENFQPTHIKTCRDGFYQALFETENHLPSAFISFFDLDDATPKGDGAAAAANAIHKAISRETAAAVRSVGNVRVLIGGYADRSGSPDHNYRLSLKRAENIRDRLIKLGIPAARMTIRAHGETHPMIHTPDGVPELKNRRVEISINLARAS